MTKRVLITGSSRGLGAELAKAWSSRGFDVAGVSRTPHALVGRSFLLDLRDPEVPYDLVEHFNEGLDVLIHNAAIRTEAAVLDVRASDWVDQIDLNLTTPMVLTRAFWPLLQATGGSVIFINSLAGLAGGKGEHAYSASKFGLRGFAQALQYDATRDGVRVFSVFLGAMRTNMTRHRADHKKLISPAEAAEAIYSVFHQQHTTLNQTEITISRSIY